MGPRLVLVSMLLFFSSEVMAYTWGLGTLPSSNGVYPIVVSNYSNQAVQCTATYTYRWRDPATGFYKDDIITLPAFQLGVGAVNQVIGSYDSRIHPDALMLNGIAECN